MVPEILSALAVFAFIVLASQQLGEISAHYKLPKISGFLIAGIIAGPFALRFIGNDSIEQLSFLNEIALAFIAFAAGGELKLQYIRGQLRSIVTILSGQTVLVMGIGIVSFLLLADYIPFMQDITNQQEILAIAILGATIMVARSPSSSLAIIKELRAKGPFTSIVLGTTVLKDAVVIIIFATAVSLADVLIEGTQLNLLLIGFVGFEILLDILLGIGIGYLLNLIMRIPLKYFKEILILLCGYAVFSGAVLLHGIHLPGIPIGIFSEPLLICMTAGFYVANYTKFGTEFHHTTEKMSPGIFVLFFTLIGDSLQIDVLVTAWAVALVLVLVRFAGIYIGSLIGGTIAKDPTKHNLVYGFGFITQAGVSIGLANEIAVEFPVWGSEFATLVIGTIVINQLIGPPLFKWVINFIGETHDKAAAPEYDGVRDVYIFGLENESLALARQLESQGWQTKIICNDPAKIESFENLDVLVECYDSPISMPTLEKIEMRRADAIVTMLSDEENYNICELVYENFGTNDMIVRLNERANFDKFHELGALIVDPSTAMVSLLDQLVRSPVAASLLLDQTGDREIIDIEVRDPSLDGIAIRDLRLPTDSLIMSVTRNGHMIVSHGFTRLHLGDEVTVVGSRESLDEIFLMLSELSE